MPKNASFDESLNELRQVSRRITEGLDQVISVLEDFASENDDIITGQEALPDDNHSLTPPEAAADDPITSVLDSIRDRIREIAQIGQDFEGKITEHASEMVEIQHQLEETRKVALSDPLTKIANRRQFEMTLEKMIGDLENYDGKLAVLLADIDKFKKTNDKLGHNVGDQVLKLVAKTMQENVKGADVIARWAGDEFTAILPDTTAKDAKTVAENVRKALSGKKIINRLTGEHLGQVTLSVGGTMVKKSDTILTLMDRADKALYKAKKAGRNKVIMDD